MKATVEVMKVTPKIAREFLANRFDGQRPIRDTWVFNLMTQMCKGEFRLSCDAIVLVKGLLANGQHRLTAVADSGISCDFIVMRTEDEELYRLIDCGIKRTTADILGGSYTRDLAAVANKILELEKGILTPLGKRSNLGNPQFLITREELLEFAEHNADKIVEAIRFVSGLRRKMNLLPISVAGGIYYLGCRRNKTRTTEFFKALFEGECHGESSALDLRHRLIKTRLSKVTLPTSYLCGLTVKALRSYLHGTRPGVLKLVDGEDFPTL